MRTRILALTLVTSIFTITSQAQFLKLKSYAVSAGLTQIQKADLNNDNKPDIVGVGSVNRTFNVTALLGDGHGGFSAPVVSAITGITLNTGHPPQAVGDFNHDGIPDFAFMGTDPVTGARPHTSLAHTSRLWEQPSPPTLPPRTQKGWGTLCVGVVKRHFQRALAMLLSSSLGPSRNETCQNNYYGEQQGVHNYI
jgi:hypothetical protein